MAQRRRDVLNAGRPRRILPAAIALAVAFAASQSLADAAEPPSLEAAPPLADSREGQLAILLPTSISEPGGASRKHWRRSASPEEALVTEAQELDSVLADALQELGFNLDLSDRMGGLPASPSEAELVQRAHEARALIVAPRIEEQGGDLLIRIVVALPDSPVLRVRVERVGESGLAVRAAVMLRDLTVGKRSAHEGSFSPIPVEPFRPSLATPARSAGRATLALNAAIFGGFVGYSIQRSSGSDDPRLLYPLMALGTGMGLGASMIVAEEWDVGIGDAWYLSAGAWWPALGGFLIAKGREATPASDRYSYAVAFAGGGIGLATFALTFKGMGEGGALLTHSGGAFGTVLGGLTELAVRGSTDAATPYAGMGYGAASGVLLAGALATQLRAPSSRVLGLDIGSGLGGLAGAAVTSPFLFGKRTEGRERTFLVSTMAGTVIGGTIGWIAAPSVAEIAKPGMGAPIAGVIAASQAKDGSLAPVWGMGWRGDLH